MTSLSLQDWLVDCGQPSAFAIEDDLAEVPVDDVGIGHAWERYINGFKEGRGDGSEYAGRGSPAFTGIGCEFIGGGGDGKGCGPAGAVDGEHGGPFNARFLPGSFGPNERRDA